MCSLFNPRTCSYACIYPLMKDRTSYTWNSTITIRDRLLSHPLQDIAEVLLIYIWWWNLYIPCKSSNKFGNRVRTKVPIRGGGGRRHVKWWQTWAVLSSYHLCQSPQWILRRCIIFMSSFPKNIETGHNNNTKKKKKKKK